MSTTLTLNYSNHPWEEETIKHKHMNVFEWTWDEMKRNETKCSEMRWGKSKGLRRIDSTWPSITFHLQSFPCSMHYLSFPSFQLCSFPFIALHFISFPFKYICLLYLKFVPPFKWLQNLGWLIRVIKHTYGPQSTLSIWIVSLSKWWK